MQFVGEADRGWVPRERFPRLVLMTGDEFSVSTWLDFLSWLQLPCCSLWSKEKRRIIKIK
jgi:hypothetical protein